MQETASSNNQASGKSKNKMLAFVLIVVLAVIAAGYFFLTSNKINSGSNQSGGGTSEETKLKQITLDEISKHNTKSDCWTTINGEVFDLTKFIGMHKGGDKILNACGVDATDYFTGKHPTIGRVHSQMAVKILQGLKIGELK